MKKFILSLALMAWISIPASASFTFCINYASFDGSFLKRINDFNNSTAILIRLDGDTFAPVNMTKPFSLDSLGTIMFEGRPNTFGGSKNTVYTSSDVRPYKNTPTAGNYVALLSHEVDGETYYNLASEINTLTDEDVNKAEVSTSFNMTDVRNTSSTLSLGGGWVKFAVPEPATGALVLAGVALLFRRRRQA